MKFAFVLNDLRLSGGVNVILQHASRMASEDGDEVFLLLREEIDESWYYPLIGKAVIVAPNDWQNNDYDIAVATYWETLLVIGEVRAESYVWFCQLYEDRFFPDRNPSISSMQIAGAIPLPVITEANWLKELLLAENPDRSVEVVVNGVDKRIFSEKKYVHSPKSGFTVLIEGSLDALAKNTGYAIEGSLRSAKATSITHVGNRPFATTDSRYRFIRGGLSFDQMAELYRSHHVQVKTPMAEGMFGPPLEGFHCGLPAIVTPVTGSEEYVEDRVNSLVVLWDDVAGVAQAIDSLAEDHEWWQTLQRGARRTADSWPDWDAQSHRFSESLVRLARSCKFTQSDLNNLGRIIQFADMMHWLAMRRLSDKTIGQSLMLDMLSGESQVGWRESRLIRRLRLMLRPNRDNDLAWSMRQS